MVFGTPRDPRRCRIGQSRDDVLFLLKSQPTHNPGTNSRAKAGEGFSENRPRKSSERRNAQIDTPSASGDLWSALLQCGDTNPFFLFVV